MKAIAGAIVGLALSGCTVIEHVQVMPTFDKQNDIGCCVLYAEPNQATHLTLSVNKTDEGIKVQAGARWRF